MQASQREETQLHGNVNRQSQHDELPRSADPVERATSIIKSYPVRADGLSHVEDTPKVNTRQTTAQCDVQRKGAVLSKACSDTKCSTCRDISRDGSGREWGAHDGRCALPKLFRLLGEACGEKMNPIGQRVGPHLVVD